MPKKIALIIMIALLALSVHAQEEPYRLAGFGNSLMGNIQLQSLAKLAEERGHPMYVESTGAAGAPIPWLWEAKTDEIKAILDKGNWDGILLQPFLRNIEEDKKGVKNFIDYALQKSPDIKIYVYAQFINDFGLDYQDVWLQDVTQYVETGESTDENIKANRTRGYYEALTKEIRKMYPDLEVVMVPAGHSFALLDQKIKAGMLPGVQSIYELYADGTHTNNFGNYLVAMTWYACIFNESPLGLPIGEYQGDPEKRYTKIISDEQARILRETAWQVAATHPLAKVTAGESTDLEIVTPAVQPAPVTDEKYTLELHAAFGKQPYKWSLAKGDLPQGMEIAESGALQGQAAKAGQSEFTVQVADASGKTATHQYRMTIEEDTAPEITTTKTDLGTVRAGEQIRLNVQAEGGNGHLRWSFAKAKTGVDNMHGLRLLGNGTLVGAIGLEGTFEFPLKVTDSDPGQPESDTKTFTVTVKEPAPEVVMANKVERGTIKGAWVFMRLEREGKGKMSDYIEQFKYPETPITTIVEGKSFNNKASFQVFHDGSSMYAAVRVVDDNIVVNPNDPTNGDSVEIFFDIFNDREKVYNADDRRAIITADGEVSGSPGQKSNPGAMRTDDGYVAYIRMPAHDMKRKLEKGAVLGFDVAVNDKDSEDGSITRVYWHGDMNNATDTSNFGTIILE
ncbi:MAG: sugar-binding protein [Candidatus Sumerlaeia bacterium]